jgi:hypothetical protein
LLPDECPSCGGIDIMIAFDDDADWIEDEKDDDE